MTSTSRPTRNAVRLGLRRGWTEFAQSIRSTQDQGFYLFTGAATVGYLFLRRDTEVEGTDLLLPSVALPSILGAFIAFRGHHRSGLRARHGEGGRNAPAA
jgi:ABC-2 type transport system permease protein